MEDFTDQSGADQRGDALLLFGGALGDFLCLLPGLASLRRRSRGRIAVVAQPAFLDLLNRVELTTISIDRSEVADLFATNSIRNSTFELFGRFATVHSWIGHGDDNFATRLATVSGGTVQIHRLRGMRPGEHASAYLARCLGVHAMTISLRPPANDADWAVDFWRQHGLDDSTLVIHPGSGSPAKNWQGMATIAQRWRRLRDGAVLLLCGPAERSVDLPHDAVVREQSLNRVAALLRTGGGYLGNDSGISHLAGLSGALGAVAFGPSDAETWRPLGNGLRVCRAGSTTCHRCGPNQFCTHVLGIDDVWEVLLAQLPTRFP
jgi:Glycosyltransferase family 9 (heptosyltransferase)